MEPETKKRKRKPARKAVAKPKRASRAEETFTVGEPLAHPPESPREALWRQVREAAPAWVPVQCASEAGASALRYAGRQQKLNARIKGTAVYLQAPPAATATMAQTNGGAPATVTSFTLED